MTGTETAVDAIEITVNGKPRTAGAEVSVERYLRELDLDAEVVVVERNGSILARQAYTTTRLAAGDRLEIVHFVGGG